MMKQEAVMRAKCGTADTAEYGTEQFIAALPAVGERMLGVFR
jgi:hypothetical protein